MTTHMEKKRTSTRTTDVLLNGGKAKIYHSYHLFQPDLLNSLFHHDEDEHRLHLYIYIGIYAALVASAKL